MSKRIALLLMVIGFGALFFSAGMKAGHDFPLLAEWSGVLALSAVACALVGRILLWIGEALEFRRT